MFRLNERIVPLAVAGLVTWGTDAMATVVTSEECVVQPNSTVELSSAVPGILAEILVDRSDFVDVGDTVARLDSQVELADVRVAEARVAMEADMRMSRASLAFDERNRERLTSLSRAQAVAQLEHDRAHRDALLSAWKLKRAEEQRELRKLELGRARVLMDRKTVRSPVRGFVIARHHQPGEFVEDEPIVTIAELDPLSVEVILPLRALGKLSPGTTARVWLETDPDTEHTAVVSVVDSVADAASATIGVRLTLPNPEYSIPAGVKCRTAIQPPTRVAGDRRSDMQKAAGSAASRPVSMAPTFDPAPVQVEPVAPASDAPVRSEPAVPEVTPASDSPKRTAAAEQPEAQGKTALPADAPPVTPEPGENRIPAPADATRTGGSPGTTDGLVVGGASSLHQEVPAGSEPVCTGLGPFTDKALADHALTSVRQRQPGARLAERVTSTTRGYVVVTTAAPGDDDTAGLMASLRAAGVADVAPLGTRNGTARAALGWYSDAAAAEARAVRLEGSGVTATVRPDLDEQRTWWVALHDVDADLPMASAVAAATDVTRCLDNSLAVSAGSASP